MTKALKRSSGSFVTFYFKTLHWLGSQARQGNLSLLYKQGCYRVKRVNEILLASLSGMIIKKKKFISTFWIPVFNQILSTMSLP